MNYTYDDKGNVLSLSDRINGQARGLTTYTYDNIDRLTKITQSGNGVSDKRVDFNYSSEVRLSSINRYADLNGTQLVTSTNYQYDPSKHLEELKHSNANSDIAFYNFKYDGGDRITKITDIDGTNDYTYDKNSRLTGANHTTATNPDEFYSYDANGNRITSNIHGNSYLTGTNNRLLSDGKYNYEYDAEGNLIAKTEIATGKIRQFEWDYRNRLISVIDKDATGIETLQVNYTYDAMNQRIASSVDADGVGSATAKVAHFIYDRNNVLLEFEDESGSSTLSKRYLHGLETDQILAQEDSNNQVLWLLGDHIGTVRDLVNNSGEVVNHLTYDSFGNLVQQTNPTANTRYQFTGREFDEATGLYYYRARYYDSKIGRFISEDPIGFGGGDTNLYGYVGNSPIQFTDPLGKGRVEGLLLDGYNRRITYKPRAGSYEIVSQSVDELLTHIPHPYL